jgi:hypothetical protein
LGEYVTGNGDDMEIVFLFQNYFIGHNPFVDFYQVYDKDSYAHIQDGIIGSKIVKKFIYSPLHQKVFYSATDGTVGYVNDTHFPLNCNLGSA